MVFQMLLDYKSHQPVSTANFEIRQQLLSNIPAPTALRNYELSRVALTKLFEGTASPSNKAKWDEGKQLESLYK